MRSADDDGFEGGGCCADGGKPRERGENKVQDSEFLDPDPELRSAVPFQALQSWPAVLQQKISTAGHCWSWPGGIVCCEGAG